MAGLGIAKRGFGLARVGMAKGGSIFKGGETYGEELREAKAVVSKKISPKQFVKGEKSEGHKGEEKGAAKIAKKIASGKMSPKQYATMETSEKMAKGGKPGLWANINARKKAGTSRSKSESTISPKAYANMKAGFHKKKK